MSWIDSLNDFFEYVFLFVSALKIMSSDAKKKAKTDDFNLPHPERKKGKTFKKQQIQKSSEEEKKMYSISTPLRNESLTATEIVWFDPVFDPQKVLLKHPVRSVEGGVSILLFAATLDNEAVEILPSKHLVVGTGFCLHTGLYENESIFGDYPNWYVSIFGLLKHMCEGIFVGSSLVDPHDRSELKIPIFNMRETKFVIQPRDPIGQLVFNGCHVPDIASISDLSERFEGKGFF